MGYIEDLRKKIGHSPIIMVGAAALIFNEQIEPTHRSGHYEIDRKWRFLNLLI